MRKLFIKMAVRHAPGQGMRWYIGRVKFMEDMWATLSGHVRVNKI